MPTYHLTITGKVQGVFYCATARRMAESLGVKGWISNTRQGNVESVVSGTEEQLNQFIRWCKSGPENARVDQVTVTITEEKLFSDFTVLK